MKPNVTNDDMRELERLFCDEDGDIVPLIGVDVHSHLVNDLRAKLLIDVGVYWNASVIGWHTGEEVTKAGMPHMVARLTERGNANLIMYLDTKSRLEA